MKLNQLRSLAAVAKAGSIQRAARELHLSQPALSKSIRELERQLGVPLLVRSADGASLTPYGAIVAKRYFSIQRELDTAREEIDWLRGELGGRLSIAVSPPAANALLAATVAEFQAQQPGVDIQLLEQRPAQIIAGLRDGVFDFGVLHHYGDERLADFQLSPLRSLRMLIVIGGHYSGNAGDAASLAQLCDEPWLAGDLADDPDSYPLVLARHFDMPPPRRILRCTSVALCLELAPRLRMVSHWSETALPFLNRHLDEGSMLQLLPDTPLPPMQIALACRDEELLSPAAASFVRMLRAASAGTAAIDGDNLRL